MEKLRKFFKLQENGTTFRKEIIAGLTTFFAMVYIVAVNPKMLSQTGLSWGGVFLATIFASVIGTLVMGLFANVPYAQAPGMGLNAFFVYTVCFGLKFSPEAALAMVFICGIINIVITVTKIRKMIIKAIPKSLQNAIGGGIGLFIAYIGFKNASWLAFTSDPGTYTESFGTIFSDSSIVPALTNFSTAAPIIALVGLIITVVLLVLKVKGSILIGIASTTIIAVVVKLIAPGADFLMDFTPFASGTAFFQKIGESFTGLGETFGVAFTKGFPELFVDKIAQLPLALLAIFAFSLSDTFDTIGTFIGTGRASGIFSDEDIKDLEGSTGFKSKMDKALFADAIATSVGAVFGTSNTTTYVESAAGIEAGGRTGLTSVTTAIMFLLCIPLAPLFALVPGIATAPALIVVGIMMAGAFKEIEWHDFEEATPAFLTVAIMAFAYNISIGIAFGFIFHVLIKLLKGKIKDVHPILYGSAILFLIYFILMALYGGGVFTPQG